MAAKTIKSSVQLSGSLMDSVDVVESSDGSTAYMSIYKSTKGMIDVIDVDTGSISATIPLSGVLVNDTDVMLVQASGNVYAASRTKQHQGNLNIIFNIPSGVGLMPVNTVGNGVVDIFDLKAGIPLHKVVLPGDVHFGVDLEADHLSTNMPDVDEDMVLDDESSEQKSSTTTLTTTSSTSTSSTSTTMWENITTTLDETTTIVYSTSTIIDETTSTIQTTTSVDERVITPRCGDGYLSWHGASGGGSEECDPNTGPYNNWSGAQRYDCPSGLTCVNCKCEGCGDGRIQQPPEECDRWTYHVTINGEDLWEGDLIEGCGYVFPHGCRS